MAVVKQMTVYADVQDAHLLHHLTNAVTTLCEDVTLHTIPSTESADPLVFLRLWEKEKLDVWPFVNNKVPIMLRFECFVTDSKTRRSGTVAYALYHRQMPVLSLADRVGMKEKEDEEEDWIAAALYCTVSSLGCISSTDAVTTFFKFPAAPGKLVALEGECALFVKAQAQLLRDHIRCEWNAPVELVGANGCDMIGADADAEEVEDGLYASLVDDLLNNPAFLSIREEGPKLHGALCALNRHYRLPILRYRLQRGIHIIMCSPISFVLEELAHHCGSQNESAEEMQMQLVNAISSIMQFEFHWLGLPKADLVLVCRDIDNSSAASTRWMECLWSERCTPPPPLEALSNWHEVGVGASGSDGRLHDDILAAVQPLFLR